MFEFMGYQCTNATWTMILGWVEMGFYAWIAYLLWRVHKLKAALAAKTAAPQAAAATRRDDQGGGRTWDIGATGPVRSPRAPEQRGG